MPIREDGLPPNLLSMVKDADPADIESAARHLSMSLARVRGGGCGKLLAILGRALVWAWWNRFGGARDNGGIPELDSVAADLLMIDTIESTYQPVYFEPEDCQDFTECRSCGMRIFWTKTKSGSNVPINWYSHVNHFIDCPNAADHRSHKQKGSGS